MPAVRRGARDREPVVYVRALAVRGTQPGEPERSLPWCWDERDDELVHASDGGLAGGRDRQLELYALPLERADYLVECAPHRFEILDRDEADELVRATGAGPNARAFFGPPHPTPADVEKCKARQAETRAHRKAQAKRFRPTSPSRSR